MTRHLNRTNRLVRLATAYDAVTPEEGEGETLTFTMPEDLSGLDDAELSALREQAVEAFDAIYAQGDDLSADDVEAMNSLADATDAIRAEEESRAEERAANQEAAEALASRVRGSEEDGDDEAEDGEGEGDAAAEAEGEAPTTEAEAEGDSAESAEAPAEAAAEERELVTASSERPRGPITVTLSGIRRRQGGQAPREGDGERRLALVASGDLGGAFSPGTDLSMEDAAHAISRKASGINESAYRAAHAAGRRLTTSFSVGSLDKGIPSELVASADNAMEVLERATDESRLPGGSLVASGGWCSPSETVYDLFSVESNDGLISLPEIGVSRGGIRHTAGPDFSTLFADTGFTFNETEDEGGLYVEGEPNTAGAKPCYKVPCAAFVEDRLEVNGVCITAGILQNRAYPELTARTIEGALVAHQHRMAGQVIDSLVAGSTAVAMPAAQVGAYAPILSAMELQTEHYKHVHRMARSATVEVIAPYWVRGVIRSDLSRRLGVPTENITNAMIDEHFAERGGSVQFVYNYQDLTGTAASFTAWPTEVKFLMYAAGTWVRGSSDIITLEAVFDSALFSLNDFTALFTEEGWLTAKRGHDSREVTVNIEADGATHAGVDIAHDGSLVPAV